MCPNWCQNNLEVRGKKEDLEKFRDYAKSKTTLLDFNNFISYPKRFRDLSKKVEEWNKTHDLKKDGFCPFKDGFNSGGYQWCVKNWGTKWNSCNATKSANTINNGLLCYDFSTAWSPPTPVIVKMSEKFPSLYFTLKYWESGMGFKGTFEVERGVIRKNVSSNYCPDDEEEEQPKETKEKVIFT